MGSNQVAYPVSRQELSTLVESIRTWAEELGVAERVQLSIKHRLGPAFKASPWKSDGQGEMAKLAELEELGGFSIQTVTVQLLPEKPNQKVQLTYTANAAPQNAQLQLAADPAATPSPERLFATTQTHFPELSTHKLLSAADPSSRVFLDQWNQSAKRLESTVLQATKELAKGWDEMLAKSEARREELEAQHRERQAELEAEAKQRKDDLAERERALEQRKKEIDDRAAKHARRALHRDLKESLKRAEKSFQLTDDTKNKRRAIHGVLLGGMALLLGISLAPNHLIPIGSDDSAQWFGLIRRSLAGLGVGAILWFYIRWLNNWFQQHARTEFRLRQMALDVDRAQWLVETLIEWRSEAEGAELPPQVLDALSRGIFEPPEQPTEQHSAVRDLASYLLHAERLNLNIGGNGLELSGRGMRRAEREAQQTRSSGSG